MEAPKGPIRQAGERATPAVLASLRSTKVGRAVYLAPPGREGSWKRLNCPPWGGVGDGGRGRGERAGPALECIFLLSRVHTPFVFLCFSFIFLLYFLCSQLRGATGGKEKGNPAMTAGRCCCAEERWTGIGFGFTCKNPPALGKHLCCCPSPSGRMQLDNTRGCGHLWQPMRLIFHERWLSLQPLDANHRTSGTAL